MSLFVAYVRRLFAASVILLLAACGGGGGGGASAPGFSVAPQSLTFSAASAASATPSAQTITVTVTSGTVYLAAAYGGTAIANATFYITGPTTAEVTVFPAAPSSLGPGQHSGTVAIIGCNDVACNSQVAGSPYYVTVTYNIQGVVASPSALTYTLGNSPVAGDLSRQFTITGYPNQNWSIGTNVSWLSVTPLVGNTGGPVQVTASLVQAQIDALGNGVYTGSITVTPASSPPFAVPVTLTISRTQVSYVAPYVATAGTTAEVIIRGENFGLVAIQDVKFGAISASTFSVISDTEVRATHPALTAGSYPVQLQNNLGINNSLANLIVVDAPVYSATTLAYPGAPSQPILAIRYDAERKALVLARGTSILRYVYSTGAWGAPASISVFNLHDVALSTDGALLLATSSGSAATGVTQIDATTLSIGTTTNDTINGISTYLVKPLSVANDGTAVVVAANGPACGNMIRYRTRNPQVTSMGGNTCSPAQVGGSADGSIIIAGTSIASDTYAFNASTGVLSTTGGLPKLTAAPVLNRTGSRIALNNTGVYNTGLSYLGGLPNTTLAVALNPIGSIAYTYDSSGSVRKFDLTGTLVAGIYPEVGTGTSLAGSPGTGVRMTITPDGGTLFIAGNSQLVVQPAP